jgi:hypothetical protein
LFQNGRLSVLPSIGKDRKVEGGQVRREGTVGDDGHFVFRLKKTLVKEV